MYHIFFIHFYVDEYLKVIVTQLCPALCDPMNCSSPGFSVRGILQAQMLERVVIPSSRGSCQCRDWAHSSSTAGSSLPSEPPGQSDGFLGCFHVLTIVNSAAVSIGCMCLFEVQFLLPGGGILGSSGSLFFLFLLCSLLSFTRHLKNVFSI